MVQRNTTMTQRSTLLAFLAVFAPLAVPARAQEAAKGDSTIIFGSLEKTPEAAKKSRHAWGVDLLLSTSGFGLGTFYRREFSENLSGFVSLSISESKDENEREVYDIWGRSYVLNKVNRFLVLPLVIGIERRLFAEDIVDNFRPFIGAAVGPTIIYVFPYDLEYFSALGKGTPKYTLGGYVGAGAYIGSEGSNLMSLNIRYYFIPYPPGLVDLEASDPKKQFGGFYFTFSFGSAW
jgi:hypothetical protein